MCPPYRDKWIIFLATSIVFSPYVFRVPSKRTGTNLDYQTREAKARTNNWNSDIATANRNFCMSSSVDKNHGYATPLKNYSIEVAVVSTNGRQRLEARPESELGARATTKVKLAQTFKVPSRKFSANNSRKDEVLIFLRISI